MIVVAAGEVGFRVFRSCIASAVRHKCREAAPRSSTRAKPRARGEDVKGGPLPKPHVVEASGVEDAHVHCRPAEPISVSTMFRARAPQYPTEAVGEEDLQGRAGRRIEEHSGSRKIRATAKKVTAIPSCFLSANDRASENRAASPHPGRITASLRNLEIEPGRLLCSSWGHEPLRRRSTWGWRSVLPPAS